MHKALVALGTLVLLTTAGCATAHSEPAGGPGLSLAAPGCPASIPGGKVAFPQAPGTTLAPANPDIGTVCRYGGMNDTPQFGLVRSKTLDPQDAAALAADLNQGKPWPTGVAFSCPADFEIDDLVIFEYDNGVRVDVLVDLTGCSTAANGSRTVALSDSARATLAALVGVATINPDPPAATTPPPTS